MTSPLDLDPEQMRRLGYAAVDALVERWQGLGEDVPWRGGARADLEVLLREPAPEEGSDPFDVLRRAQEEIVARAGRIDHPRFFAFVPAAPTWPSVLGDFLAGGSSVFQGTWLESAGPSQCELVVIDWIREWLAYPDTAGGLFTSGGSAANLCALVAAREAAGNPADPVVYLSDQGHSSLERAARIAGIYRKSVRTIETDGDFRMRPSALAEAIEVDRAAGRVPVCVCANAGATNTGAVDPLDAVADVCAEAGVWLHVDGAYGAFAVLTERGRRRMRGIERADSVTLDPHKWFFQPYEAGCLMARDVSTLESAFRILPEYLQDTELGMEHVNFADRGLQLTRSFRALKVWMSVQTFGLRAFRDAIDHALDVTGAAAERIRDSDRLATLAPASLGVVCFRYVAPGLDEAALEELNTRIQSLVVEEGTAMMSSTRLRGRYSLRLCVLNFRSTREDVLGVLDRIEAIGARLSSA